MCGGEGHHVLLLGVTLLHQHLVNVNLILRGCRAVDVPCCVIQLHRHHAGTCPAQLQVTYYYIYNSNRKSRLHLYTCDVQFVQSMRCKQYEAGHIYHAYDTLYALYNIN